MPTLDIKLRNFKLSRLKNLLTSKIETDRNKLNK